MKIVVLGNDASWNELIQTTENVEWIRANELNSFYSENSVQAYFILQDAPNLLNPLLPGKPVFINSVVNTLNELNVQKNIIRINGWTGFLEKELWEVCGILNDEAISILHALGKKYIIVPDAPGFITARIIAMIINEAYYTTGENVSSENEIDTAMKLGTNYPFGPFEWAKIIGIKNIYNLLDKLSVSDKRYSIAPALKKIIHL
ncbi:MAG: 3-hydroxyacyl-CoA dehydrogenase family protein [Ferruginibacter sp.]